MGRIRSLFRAPHFDDDVMSLDARKLWFVLLTLLAGANCFLPAAIQLLPDCAGFIALALGAFDFSAVGLLLFTRAGRFRLAAILLVADLLIIIGSLAWRFGGLGTGGMMALVVVVAIAGILLERAAALATGGAALLLGIALTAAEVRHSLPPIVAPQSAIALPLILCLDVGVLLAVQAIVASIITRARTIERERSHTAAALRENEERFARVFNHAPVFISISTLDRGTFLVVNEQALKVSGFRRDEMIGHSALDLGWISKEARERLIDGVRKEGRVIGCEMAFRKKDGTELWALVNAEELTLRGQRCLLTIMVDVTAIRRAHEQLNKLSQAIEQSSFSVVITDVAGVIEYCNPKFCEVTGYSAEELLGRTTKLLKSGETPLQVYEELWRTVTNGRTWRGVLHNRKKDGTLFWEDQTISPIRDATGKITHFVGVKEDLTARKRLEEQYRQAQKMEAVGQLAGGIAHDYNNILTATTLRLTLLREQPELSPVVRRGLDELDDFAQRAIRLTRQLLTFSRAQPIAVVPVEMNELIKNLRSLLDSLLGENIKVVTEFGGGKLWLRADLGMMEQVITNLVVNSRDSMAPKGGVITITTGRVQIDAVAAAERADAYPGEFVIVEVRDTGCGMSPATMERIFEPFFTTKPVGKGTGLGLATVFGIVQQHHGWIEVHSREGEGSRFQILLPATPHHGYARATPSERKLRFDCGGRILLVEDDLMVRTTMAAAFVSRGYEVLEAGTGPQAVAALQRNGIAIDLLVTDMIMPGGMDGVDVAAAVRKLQPEVRVIICTGHSREYGRDISTQVPGALFLNKPVDMPTLTEHAWGLIRQKVAGDGAGTVSAAST